jgi:single-stranded DNA-binding protein
VDDMSVRTQQSLTGYIASDPQLTFTSRGEARFYARVGQEQFRRLDDGTFEKAGVEYTDLVQYRTAAERAYEQFRKGDSFIAEGYIHQYDQTQPDGTTAPREEFVAKKLGHDAARTTYAVDRAPRSGRDQGVEQPADRSIGAPADRRTVAPSAGAPVAL